jgi:hypothetical protein
MFENKHLVTRYYPNNYFEAKNALERRPLRFSTICARNQGLLPKLQQGGHGRGDSFFTPYKFCIFNADDEIRVMLPIRRYRIVMIIFIPIDIYFNRTGIFKNNSKMTDKI